jgi:hypothetical protein
MRTAHSYGVDVSLKNARRIAGGEQREPFRMLSPPLGKTAIRQSTAVAEDAKVIWKPRSRFCRMLGAYVWVAGRRCPPIKKWTGL